MTTMGDWKVNHKVDDSGDYPCHEFEIISVKPYGPEGIGTAYSNPYNAVLFSKSKEMYELLLKLRGQSIPNLSIVSELEYLLDSIDSHFDSKGVYKK